MAATSGTSTADLNDANPFLDAPPEINAPADLKSTLLGQDLAEDAHSFEFFQAVNLLQRLLPDLRPVGGFSNPEEEVVSFRINQRMGFPASEIQKLEPARKRSRDDSAGVLPPASPATAPQEMMVNFMGLTGPQGVLPYTYNELILERARAKDHNLAAFLDIFNHRIISLFYRAWAKARFPVTYSLGARDLFTRYLLDFVGLGTAGLQDRQDVPDQALLHYVALIANQSRSAAALEQIIADYFQVPVEIEQFTGAWYALDEPTQCAMTEDDSASHQVGSGAVVGDAIWERQARVRIRLGPLNLECYSDFLPGAPGHSALRAITRFFSNDCIDFEVQLVLDRAQAPGVALDSDSAQPARLGWISWIKNAPMAADPDNTLLTL